MLHKTVLPSVARPAVQFVHTALAPEVLPGGQVRHWLVPEAAYVPGKQAVQLDLEEEARGEILPERHGKQSPILEALRFALKVLTAQGVAL
jgi:hypothetical protein